MITLITVKRKKHLEWCEQVLQALKEKIKLLEKSQHDLIEDAGDQKSIYVGDCGFFCELGENDN